MAVNPDGTGLRPLYTPGSGDPITGPAWSPDGNKLAFAYQDKINVLDLAARSVTSLTTPGAGERDVDPAWLADGDASGSGASGRSDPGRSSRRASASRSVARSALARVLDLGVSAFAFAPGLDPVRLPARRRAAVVRRRSGAPDRRAPRARRPGPRDATKLAYVDAGSVWGSGLRFRTTSATRPRTSRSPTCRRRRHAGRRTAARSRSSATDTVMHVPARAGATPVRRPGHRRCHRRRLAAVHVETTRSVAGPCSRRRAARRPRR